MVKKKPIILPGHPGLFFRYLLFLFLIFECACSPSKKMAKTLPAAVPAADTLRAKTAPLPEKKNESVKTDPFLEDLLKQYPQYFDSILQNRDAMRVQIIYTQIDRGANNIPRFRNYFFNVNEDQYFYPASTVKLPIAALALQKIHELGIAGLDRKTTMITESAYSGQSAVYQDPTAPDGRPSLEQYIRKIFLISDNDAFNRLYEFLGQEYINDQLHKMGYSEAQIMHRLELTMTGDENRHTNPVQFRDSSNLIIYDQAAQYNEASFPGRNDFLGAGFYRNDSLIGGPMDFSRKNHIGLESLHNILRSILVPRSVGAGQRFDISNEDYQFLKQYMSEWPRESNSPSYDSNYYDAYCKFILLGSDKDNPSPANIRIFNKVGDAYGFLLDIAYVADFANKVEFMLSAVIYCNKDGIINDDHYDYEELGYPFMKRLGEVIYDYELKRNRKHPPDLSEFQIKYN